MNRLRAVASSLGFVVALCLAQPTFAQTTKPNVPTMPVEQIRVGMKGVAYTVFEGTKPEPMDVEVLGVLRNMSGPKGDVILVRLGGEKAKYTGVVAGMSGSPVYIDGKLIGALAYRIGEFSKEPIGGVTPIASMLEINEIDNTPVAEQQVATSRPETQTKTSVGGGSGAPVIGVNNYLKPIEAPLVFTGFSEDTVRQFSTQFAAAGVTPVMGAGSVSDTPQPEKIEPGSAISAVLVRGDMNIAATCTVTYVDPQRLLACGHPIMNFGRVDLPMYKANVLATLPSPANAFKIVNTTQPVGAFVQDRHTGILGRFNEEPEMIPVTLTFHGITSPKSYKYEVLSNSKLTPVAMMATVFNALQGINEYGEDTTYRMRGAIDVAGFPTLAMQNMFAPADGQNPTAYSVATNIGERFGRIFENPYERPEIKGVRLDFDLVKDRKWARLETARTDVTEARPGDEIVVETVLRPYRGERIVRQIPIKVPTSTPRGTLRILVSDGDTLDRMQRFATLARKFDLSSTIAMLNKEHENSRLYVSLLEANPQAMVEDKVMPTLPLSVMNVMDGMRGTQDMVVVGESAVNETSTPLDYVVAGTQVLTVNIR